MSLFGYHLRLACSSLWRDTSFTVAMLLCLAIANAIWGLAAVHYSAVYLNWLPAPPGLHQVQTLRDTPLAKATASGKNMAIWIPLSVRQRMSHPEVRQAMNTGIPTRETATYRAFVQAQGSDGPASRVVARFVTADFFNLFPLPFVAGTPWSRADDAAANRVVLGRALSERLFPEGGAVKARILLDGQSFEVAGVLRDRQPVRPDWDPSSTMGDEDALYIPFAAAHKLRARPDFAAPTTAAPDSYDDLLRSDLLYLTMWVELPTAEARARYEEHLTRVLGASGARPRLASRETIEEEYRAPQTPILFFTVLCSLVLVGGGFNFSRLLLAKSVSRAAELGVFRALGATRGKLFARQMTEVVLVSSAAAVLGPFLATPLLHLFNVLVYDTDIPRTFTTTSLLIAVLPSIGVGIIGGIYPSWQTAKTRPTLYLGKA